MAVYGYNLPSITSPLKETIKAQVVEDQIQHQQEVLKLLKENLVMTKDRMKNQSKKYHSETEFEVAY